jgi:stage V sporulation protein AE
MERIIDYIWVFIVGGLLCAIAQIIIDKTKITPARILVLYVCVGVVLTGIGIYQPLVELAGRGATIPLVGFGYALANGVKEAVDQNGLIGVITGGLTATAGGITAAISCAFIASLFFKGKA